MESGIKFGMKNLNFRVDNVLTNQCYTQILEQVNYEADTKTWRGILILIGIQIDDKIRSIIMDQLDENT